MKTLPRSDATAVPNNKDNVEKVKMVFHAVNACYVQARQMF